MPMHYLTSRGRGRHTIWPVLALLLLLGATGSVGAQNVGEGPSSPMDATVARRINTKRLSDTLQGILRAGVRDSAFPGAIAVIGTRDGVLARATAGHIDWAASPAPTGQTLWDLASLTKVVALTSAMLQLVDQGRVLLDAPVQRYLPGFTGTWKDQVTVRHLLTHSSGLPAWRPLYKEATTAQDAMALVYATPLDTVPGVRMVYSDLGAILLGEIVRVVTGESLDTYTTTHVFGPLRMRDTQYRPPVSLLSRIAPTEVDPWRQRHLRGEVHDENAFALGGVSAHAGLFSTADDLVRLARAYLNHGTLDAEHVFSDSTIRLFTTVQNPGLSNRALGWETPTGGNSAGHALSSHAFGHTGFTGTSIWIDPDNNLFILLLTNRVNPTREHRAISGVRIAVADAAMSIVGAAARPSP
ncbi:MAG: serine hydrolase domain-containing protein [Gemmatimonadaceae bacterium]